jgi:drug/metabolite transporter (DMT)-like permease
MGSNSVAAPPEPSSGAGAFALLVVLGVIWGLAFVAVRAADFELSPLSLLLIRWLISCAGFLAVLPFSRPKTRFDRRDFPRILVFSLLMVVMYGTFLNYAETSISSGLAGLLVSLGPIFIVAFSVVSLKERLTRRVVLALLLALAGCVLLSLSDLNPGGTSLDGVVEGVLAALTYATFTVLSKPLVEKYGALSVTIWGTLLGTVFLLPLASGAFFAQVSVLSADGWASVVYLSIASTVIGYTMFYSLVGKGALSTLSVQLYLVPVVSVVGGILLLHEQLTLLTLPGGAATLVAIGLTRSRGR